MHTVGIFLKKEREANNISLEEVARQTKISPLYLEHIEKNEFEKIPQGPYIKGYISSYSRAIGCDAEKLIHLYEAENRKQAEAEAAQQAAASDDGGKRSTDRSRKKNGTQNSSLLLGRLRSGFNTLVSVVVDKGAAFKAAGKPVDGIDSPQPDAEAPSRHHDLPANKSGFIGAIQRRSTDRRIWLYACMAVVAASILILAGVGFYHLFLHTPDSLTTAEAERSPDGGDPPLPSSGSQPSTLLSPPADGSATVEPPERPVNKNELPEPARPDEGVSGTSKNAERSSAASGPAVQAGPPSSDAASTANRDDSNRGTEGAALSGRHPLTSDPPPEPATVDAPLRVLKAAVCSAVENHMPVGVDRFFPLSAGKIYVWTEIEATQVPSKIRHIYYFGGKKISDVSLDVRSPRWRTWSYKTIAEPRYLGEWRVEIATADGKILRQLYFEIN
jgi:transcriptional regulator with XRE-family HTH domain